MHKYTCGWVQEASIFYFFSKIKVKPGIEFVNNFISYIQNGNFLFYVEMIIVVICTYQCQNFHKINFVQKIPKST